MNLVIIGGSFWLMQCRSKHFCFYQSRQIWNSEGNQEYGITKKPKVFKLIIFERFLQVYCVNFAIPLLRNQSFVQYWVNLSNHFCRFLVIWVFQSEVAIYLWNSFELSIKDLALNLGKAKMLNEASHGSVESTLAHNKNGWKCTKHFIWGHLHLWT